MKKRTVLLGVMLVILIAVMAGCKDSESKASNEQGGSEGEGSGFSIAMRTLATPYVESHPDINEDKYVKELEKLTGTDINIRLVPHNEYVERMTLMLASNDIPDVMQAGGGVLGPELAGGVEAGAFMPLDDLLKKHGQHLLEAIPQEAWDRVTYDGKIYAIPEYLSNPSRRGTAIRMDLLEKTGLDVPKTTDEFLEVMRAFKELGVKNPYQGREDFKYSDTFFGAFDAFPYQWELYNDEVVPKFMAGDKIKDALEYYRTMYEEGLIHPEFLTIQQPEYRSNIIAGNTGMWSMNAEEVNAWEQEIQNNVPEAEVAIIPSPVGPDGKGGHYLYGQVTRSFLISSETEANVEDIIKFFDWQVTEEAERFFTYGIEGDTYTLNDDGSVNYEMKDDTNFLNEQHYRNRWLWMIRDATYTEGILELTEEGQQLMSVFDEILSNEGRDSILYDPPLEAMESNPDIRPGSDTPSDVWMTGAAKIILGQEPLDYHDTIVEEWLNKGGSQAIEEATKRYNEDDGVLSR
ncbi:extracellular solute-binding protein [Sediminibacillus halophilus]|uniref:Putative aldouronate transport system substrate-binding protein n=1 Tax=Sediminibacillus halophilus TaxID=482461 RepID=A0A1G9RU38_9BACI|nr:extracellular solute-binding protein [Sediminibacillus halophilus]SDM26703.1 putative aldouronate transport system substrate-binding protein [Sediminibacillus halophilus]